MSNITLSEARVKTLRSRPSAYDIRDSKLRGFGVRVLPSGAKRFFIHAQHRGTRVWKMVGDSSAITVDAARVRAASLLATIRCDADAPASPDATRFETVAEAVFRRYTRVWKPQMLYVNRHYLHRQILPQFVGTQIAANHPRGREALVRIASSHPRRRRPLHARALRHHDRGRAHGLPSRGLQIPAGGYDAIAARGANGSCPMPRLAALGQRSWRTRANGRFRSPQFGCFCSPGAVGARC